MMKVAKAKLKKRVLNIINGLPKKMSGGRQIALKTGCLLLMETKVGGGGGVQVTLNQMNKRSYKKKKKVDSQDA